MKIQLHKDAAKFLDKLNKIEKNDLLLKISKFISRVEELKVLPVGEFNIKKLSGKWDGFKRLKLGNIRVIFKEDISHLSIYIYIIDYRGNLY